MGQTPSCSLQTSFDYPKSDPRAIAFLPQLQLFLVPPTFIPMAFSHTSEFLLSRSHFRRGLDWVRPCGAGWSGCEGWGGIKAGI